MQLHWLQHLPVDWTAEGRGIGPLMLILKGWLFCCTLLGKCHPLNPIWCIKVRNTCINEWLEGVKVGEAIVFLQVVLLIVRGIKIYGQWALWTEQENVKVSILLGTLLLFIREYRAGFIFHSTDVLVFDMTDHYGWELNWPHLLKQSWMRVIPIVPFLPWEVPLLVTFHYWDLVAR